MNRRNFLKLPIAGLILSQVPLIKVAKPEIINTGDRVIKIFSLPLEDYGNRLPTFCADVKKTFISLYREPLHIIHCNNIEEKKEIERIDENSRVVKYGYYADIVIALPGDIISVSKLYANNMPFRYKAEIIQDPEYAYVMQRGRDIILGDERGY